MIRPSHRRSHGKARGRNVRSKSKCSVCPAIHTKSRSWLRSSSTREPSDPPLRVVFLDFSISTTKQKLLFFFSRPAHPMPSRKRKKKPLLKRLFVNQNKRTILEKRRKRGRCAFCNPRIVPVHLKSPLNRGSRGLPLGASSKGTEATQRKRHIRTTVVFFCAVPTASKLGRDRRQINSHIESIPRTRGRRQNDAK